MLGRSLPIPAWRHLCAVAPGRVQLTNLHAAPLDDAAATLGRGCQGCRAAAAASLKQALHTALWAPGPFACPSRAAQALCRLSGQASSWRSGALRGHLSQAADDATCRFVCVLCHRWTERNRKRRKRTGQAVGRASSTRSRQAGRWPTGGALMMLSSCMGLKCSAPACSLVNHDNELGRSAWHPLRWRLRWQRGGEMCAEV